MTTFRDYLIYYNYKHVAPFIKAINEHMTFFSQRGIDMFKDSLDLPEVLDFTIFPDFSIIITLKTLVNLHIAF